jgi:hypothetical protein
VEIPGYDFSEHARDVILEREIAITWVAQALETPERIEVDRRDPTLRHALARIVEYEDRVLRVVYNAAVDPPRIVTAYFDRRQRGKT